jgi:hypothetical protein
MFIELPGVAMLSGGSTMLRPCESMLLFRECIGGGRPKSTDSSAWPPSSSSFCGSTTGSVMVNRNTGNPATMPSIFSQMFFSPQLVRVGNSVPNKMCGGGRTDGHQRGILAGS